MVWLLYVCMYKYSFYLEGVYVPPEERGYFPYPQLILYAICMTLYIIPLYRWLIPTLLNRKKYAWFFLSLFLYFEIVPKIGNYLVSSGFLQLNGNGPLHPFFYKQFHLYELWLTHWKGWDLQMLFTDMITFLSIAFIRLAFENEQKKHLLEKDNLVLQLDSLKAQLHPHFLFNTLNSIYGMSLSGSPETPEFILRLSDMMRFILYDCRHHAVPLEKDIEFLENYIAMETKRYPTAQIQFTISQPGTPYEIAPLLLIPFVENSFKHGSHRVMDQGSVQGWMKVENDKLHFVLENDVFASTRKETQYGGVGIANVRRRLELYYPGRHTLTIHNDQRQFRVDLLIQLNP
jgi:hypothetical protein